LLGFVQGGPSSCVDIRSHDRPPPWSSPFSSLLYFFATTSTSIYRLLFLVSTPSKTALYNEDVLRFEASTTRTGQRFYAHMSAFVYSQEEAAIRNCPLHVDVVLDLSSLTTADVKHGLEIHRFRSSLTLSWRTCSCIYTKISDQSARQPRSLDEQLPSHTPLYLPSTPTVITSVLADRFSSRGCGPSSLSTCMHVAYRCHCLSCRRWTPRLKSTPPRLHDCSESLHNRTGQDCGRSSTGTQSKAGW
jgi:hypothetical protein